MKRITIILVFLLIVCAVTISQGQNPWGSSKDFNVKKERFISTTGFVGIDGSVQNFGVELGIYSPLKEGKLFWGIEFPIIIYPPKPWWWPPLPLPPNPWCLSCPPYPIDSDDLSRFEISRSASILPSLAIGLKGKKINPSLFIGGGAQFQKSNIVTFDQIGEVSLKSQVNPAATYGVAGRVPLTKNLTLKGTLQGITTFSKETVMVSSGNTIGTIKGGVRTSLNATLGVGMNF